MAERLRVGMGTFGMSWTINSDVKRAPKTRSPIYMRPKQQGRGYVAVITIACVFTGESTAAV